jgi:hypothetical protein
MRPSGRCPEATSSGKKRPRWGLQDVDDDDDKPRKAVRQKKSRQADAPQTAVRRLRRDTLLSRVEAMLSDASGFPN